MKQKDLIFLSDAYSQLLHCNSNKNFYPRYLSFCRKQPNLNKRYDFPSFGSSIEKCIKCTQFKGVPAVVSGCIREVEERGITSTGLYRLSGNEKAINSLINEIDKDPRSVDYKAAPWTDIHNTCAVLKQFFRRLAEPLIPTDLYRLFMEAAEMSPSDRCEAIKALVQRLPECHQATAKLLFRHLANVAAHAEDNKMHIYNLAIIFGPTLIRSSSNDMVSLVADMSSQYKVVECFIAQYGYIFDEESPIKPAVEEEQEGEEQKPEAKPEQENTDEMRLFGSQKPAHRPSLNGLTTPSDDRASLPTEWEYHSDEVKVEMSDKSTQCNIPKSPRVEDKIYYRKEPIGIVHPYKDDIKMRPNSRILDKKLVSLDPRGGGTAVEGPKKSLSLESLMDIIQTENKKRHLTKRGYSQQFESIQKFVTGLQKTTGRRSPPKTTPTVCTAQPAPQQPMAAAPPPQTNLVRPVPHYPRTPLYAIPQQRKTSVPDDPSREKPWISVGKPERYVSRSEDQLGRSQLPPHHAPGLEGAGKFRRHSEVNRGAKWQPGKTHRWVLDNNTTMLESTL